jgi:type IX secretion system PorP/SprF family membrane protein
LAKAQQSPEYTLYMNNPFLLNPAIAGTFQYFQARMSSRLQWIGFGDGAPVTNAISLYGPWSAKRKNMGVGGSIVMDATGPISSTSFSGSYAYNINLNEQYTVSSGLAMGGVVYKLDGTKILTGDKTQQDPVLQNAVNSKTLPNATVGVYITSNIFQAGLSADNLFNSNLSFHDGGTATKGLDKLVRHYYLFGSYRYAWNRAWAIEPSMLLKAVTAAPIQADIDCRVHYKNTYWFGLAVRTQDAISIMGGCFLNKKYYIGYSYDYAAFSQMRSYSLGSHEFLVGYKFNTLK